MKKGFYSYFQDLALKAKTTANSKEAQEIRKKLIKTGIILLVIGGIGLFTCFISFGILSFAAVENYGEGFGFVLIPFFLIIPFGLVLSLGSTSLYCGLGISVVGVATNFVDPNIYCPNCGDVVKEDEMFCDHCGEPLLSKKICKKCNTENDLDSKFCKSCGNELS